MLEKTLKLKNKLMSKRKARVRGKIHGTASKPRIAIFRSNKYFYAQAIDDDKGVTLASVDGKKLGLSNNKNDVVKIAETFSQNLKGAGISTAIFDRSGYLYHGVVAGFADSLRQNGIAL